MATKKQVGSFMIGNKEDIIIEILRRGDKKISELSAIIYGQADSINVKKIKQSLDSLIRKEIVSQNGLKYHLEHYPEIIGTISQSGIQRRVTVPNRQITEDWKPGTKVKLVKLK